jgi:D-amino-acid dehydrogenase
MKIAIVGAGVAGLMTAKELSDKGHEVAVFDKNGAAGEGSTFASGGIFDASYPLPFTYKGSHLSRFLRQSRGFSSVRWTKLGDVHWMWQRARFHSDALAARREDIASKLIQSGIDINVDLIAKHQWDQEQSFGQTVLLKNEADIMTYEARLPALRAAGLSCQTLESSEIHAIEPSLAGNDSFLKAIHFPQIWVVNCRQLVLNTKQELAKNGVDFQFNCKVTEVVPGGQPLLRTESGGSMSFDHIVLCTESLPTATFVKLSLRAPVATISAYALSVPIREPLNAPKSAIRDANTGITISRLGRRIRVCGGGELNMSNKQHHDKQLVSRLFKTLDQYFPGAASYAAGTQIWRGSNTHTADGLPLVGKAGVPGVWLNMAHGSNGAGMASAAARLLCEQIETKSAHPASEYLDPLRFSR